MVEMVHVFTAPEKGFGIDLGTTNSCIAVLEDGGIPRVIKLKSGGTTMPSCVMWKGGDDFVVGKEAYCHSDQPNVAYSMKRMMGTDESVQLRYDGEERKLTPVEFSTLVLKNLVEEAGEMYKDIRNVVITVPAHFNNKEIEDTLEAGKRAGLNVLQIMREPTAAALLYDNSEKDSKILVYDLGGGTFDVSLVEIFTKDNEMLEAANAVYGTEFKVDGSGVSKIYNVKKNDGDMRLGGDDVDQLLVNVALSQLTQAGLDVELIPKETKEWLRLQVESFKKMGSFLSVDLKVCYEEIGSGRKVEQGIEIKEADLKRAVMSIYRKSKAIAQGVLKGESLAGLDAITLVGGSTKSAILKKALSADFPAVHINDSLNPDEAVALGAAIQANRLLRKDGSLSIQDITPLAIGVDSAGKMKHLIEKNTKIPFSRTEKFTTVQDGQESIAVNVYQGNTTLLEECTYLGSIVISDLEPRKAGEVEIYVRLQSDSNGLLFCTVTVDDKTSTKELKNLLGAEQESKRLSPKERRLLVWGKKVASLPDGKDKERAEELLQLVKGDDTKATLELTKLLSGMSIKKSGLMK